MDGGGGGRRKRRIAAEVAGRAGVYVVEVSPKREGKGAGKTTMVKSG